MADKLQEIQTTLGSDRVKVSEPMSRHTTFRIGGPADLYFEAKTGDEVVAAVRLCRRLEVPYTVIGLGSNLLVGDKGIRGLVIRPILNYLRVEAKKPDLDKSLSAPVGEHYQAAEEEKYLKFTDLDLTEPPADTLVTVGVGMPIAILISQTLDLGLTGLQNFSGIPASVGGAIYNNIHGGTKLFDQFVYRVLLLNSQGETVLVDHDRMNFKYDYSRVQDTREVILEVTLALSHGDAEEAKRVRTEWLKRKLRVQPQQNCPGCTFKNLTPQEAKRIGAPSVAAAWVIDHGLGLKGTKVGGVSVSSQHANFFVNDGTAKATDVLKLISLCQEKAKKKFSLELTEEIQKIGEF